MIGSGELIVILCIMLLLFGGKRLPELAKSLGSGIREFKKACNGDDEADSVILEAKIEEKQKENDLE